MIGQNWSEFQLQLRSMANMPLTVDHIYWAMLCICDHLIFIITGRNEVVAKVMFLQVCVCPRGGEGVCLSACWDAIPSPRDQADAPQNGESPLGPGRPPQNGEPPRTRQSPPWIGESPRTRQSPPRMENPPGPGRHPPPRDGRTPREADSSIRSTSSRYASHWNAFLL